ncbi:MAG: hypothetical protein WCO78_00945 [Candidatus Roizmanbacteria bacterium]
MTPERILSSTEVQNRARTELEALKRKIENEYPKTPSGIRDLAHRFSTDDAFRLRLEANPEVVKDYFAKDAYSEIIQNLATGESRRAHVLQDRAEGNDEGKVTSKLVDPAFNLKRLLNMIGDSDIQKRLRRADDPVGFQQEGQLLSNKSVGAIRFLEQLSKQNLSVFNLARLVPLVMRVISNREYFKITQKTALQNLTITENRGSLTDTIISPFGTDVIRAARINLAEESFERDLVLLKMADNTLFDAVWNTYTQCISGLTPDEQTAIGSPNAELTELKVSVTKAANKLGEYASQIIDADMPTEDSDDLTIANERQMKALADRLRPFDLNEIIELEEKGKAGTASPEEVERLNNLRQYEDLLADRDELKKEKLLNEKTKLTTELEALKEIPDAAKTPQQKARLKKVIEEIEELQNNRMYDTQIKASLTENPRKMLLAISQTTQKRMEEIAAASSAKDKHYEMWIARWSGTFILATANTTSYLSDFYKPFYDEIRDQIKNASTTQYDHHELEKLTLERVEKEIQNIISSIITSTLSPAMEAGGEPVGTLDQALQMTNSNARLRLGTLLRALTRLKIDSSTMTELPPSITGIDFANVYRDTQDVWDPKERRMVRVQTGRPQHEHGHDGKAFFKHARELEEYFEVFNAEIAGNYDIRACINDAHGDFYKQVMNHEGKLNHYSLSKQFDIIHNSDIGPEVAAALPLCKVLMMRYFAEKGWVADEEINRDLSEPKGYLNTIVSKFMKDNYPHYSENKRNMITYISVKQAYLHSVYQLMLSNSRFLSGFGGGKHKENNAYFYELSVADKYAGSLSQFDYDEFIGHKTFARGAMFMPGAPDGFDGIADIDPSKINNYFDAGYGSVMHELSGKYGLFLRHINPRFEKHLPDSLHPRNRNRNGSDENLRGWRQLKKSKDNVSRKLYTFGDRKDWVILNSGNTDASHYADIWKSVENMGTNYLRSWMDELVAGEYNEPKVRFLMAFLYRRYFDGSKLGVDFGRKVLSNLGVSSVTSDTDFAQKVIDRIAPRAVEIGEEQKKKNKEVKVKANKSAAAKEVMKSIFYGANLVLMAERTPTVLMDATTPWTEQTGLTLIAQIKNKMATNPAAYADFFQVEPGTGKTTFANWQQTTEDLALVQTEARKATTTQIMKNREHWENLTKPSGYESNTFGESFGQDRSSIQLVDGPTTNEAGYVITDAYITQVLTEKYKAKGMSDGEIQNSINRALIVRKEILEQMLEAPKVPDYDEFKNEVSSLMDKAIKKGPTLEQGDIDANKAKIMANLGATRAEYEAKYQQKLKTRAAYFMEQWNKDDMVFEPECDTAENFMHYENADANHIGRMAGITEATSVKMKADLAYNQETSINEMVKNFAKDPYAAIDKMADYLNKYRHVIEDERGADYSKWYVGWYVNKVLEANLKEERYRTGFGGAFRDVQKILFGQSKTSFGGDKFQPFTSKSISALEGYRIIRYLIQKKLIGPLQGDEYMKRYRSTIGDIIKEAAPRVGVIAFVAFAIHLTKSSTEKDTDLK